MLGLLLTSKDSDATPVTDELDTMTAEQLKALCQERGLKTAGKKDELKRLIREHFGVCNPSGDNESDYSDEYDAMTTVHLKAVCKEKGLKLSGKKAELIGRIREHFGIGKPTGKKNVHNDEFDAMTENDLRDALVVRGLSKKGNRDELIERLRNDIDYTNELTEASKPNNRDDYIALSDALQAAAKEDGSSLAQILEEVKKKTTAESRYMDVTITSIGLEPIKYTAGGAPSVTAPVLSALAGDPFAIPPKYGKVCFRAAGLASPLLCLLTF
jgi:SAP domain